MAVLLEAIGWLVIVAAAPVVLLAAVLGRRHGLPGGLRRRRHDAAEPPSQRTLEVVAADVRRISARFHQQGMRFAQYEGRRQAYDRVLAEAAEMLEVEHLLGVLPSSRELDDERQRVEAVLSTFGVLRRPDTEPRQP